MPFAISILGSSFSDGMVLEIAKRFEATFGQPAGVGGKRGTVGGNQINGTT
jgi:Asp-tRNA(Asn)/Glu-tRNA(Gln) amidotransferase A subunit family amidase